MKTERQPGFEFAKDENLGQKSENAPEQTIRSPKEDELGTCSQCGLPLGTGTCPRCIRISRQRGQAEIEGSPKASRLINRPG